MLIYNWGQIKKLYNNFMKAEVKLFDIMVLYRNFHFQSKNVHTKVKEYKGVKILFITMYSISELLLVLCAFTLVRSCLTKYSGTLL